MGYTHYWTTKRQVEASTWNKFQKTVAEIIKASSVSIKDGQGKGLPEITKDCICLNGDESKGEDFETMHIAPNGVGEYCKTAMKPYDEVVVAILIAGKSLGILDDWGSDGEKADGDFDAGIKLLSIIGFKY